MSAMARKRQIDERRDGDNGESWLLARAAYGQDERLEY
jgi:hypothetical protein